jgi:predicted secreted Zn-dependent protease
MTQPGRTRPGGSRRSPRPSTPVGLLVGLVALVVAGCLSLPVAGPTDPPATGAATPAPTTPSGQPGASADASPPASPRPSAPPAVAGELDGSWRVRRVLALDDRGTLVPGATFTDEVYAISASCDAEPCPEIVVRATPAGRARPVTETTLRRDGDAYVSDASAGVDVPCQNGFGDRVPGGATATTTMRLWLASVRPAGSAVETLTLVGTLDLAITPTDLGASAGCTPQSAAYDLTGKRGAVAIIGGQKPPTEIPDGVETAALPDVDAAIRGATVVYFDVEGTTVADLDEAIGNGAMRACGAIRYEWIEGDPTPAACTVTHFPDFETALRERGSGDACRLQSDAEVRFTVHLPRWSSPARVPAVLIEWWRETVEFIRVHEAGHVRISLDHTERLDDRLDGARCDDAEDIIQEWAKDLSEAQEAFDRVEYQKPWPEPPPGA